MSRMTKTLLIAAVVVVLAGGGLLAWGPWRGAAAPEPLDPKMQTPEQVRAYLASDEFASLPVERRKSYFRAVRDAHGDAGPASFMQSDASEEQREKARQSLRPVFRQMMQERMDKYFALPADKRPAYLDGLIDEMQSRQAAADKTGGAAPHGRGGPPHSPDRMKSLIESTAPEDRARHVEFIKAMRERMDQRGMHMPSGPPR